MDFSKQLQVLQATHNNPALLALAMVDIAHHALPDTERTKVKEALLATAVPHWCDSAFLAALLDTKPEDSELLLGYLRILTAIESFPARGEHAVNVHEATRLALRDHLRTTDIARWKALSYRALTHVCQSTETHSRIEALYHLFAIDAHAAATSYESLNQEFINAKNSEAQQALTLALEEHTAAGWLTDAAIAVTPHAWQKDQDSPAERTQHEFHNTGFFVSYSKSPPPTHLLLVDDHEMVRRGLRALLHLEPDMKIVGDAGTVADAVELVEQLDPQMVLLDVKLPDATVAEACRRLLAIAPKLRILILTSYTEDATVMSAVQNGAQGYVLKDVRMSDLIHAIRTVASGHGYLDPRVTQQALHWTRTNSPLAMTSQVALRLSPKERLILPLLAKGKTNREIAVQLGVSDKTVRNHLANIFDKFHFKRRTDAVAWFMSQHALGRNTENTS